MGADSQGLPQASGPGVTTSGVIPSSGGNGQSSTPSPFSDISTSPYEKAIETEAASGVLKGYPGGTFQPQGKITRGEMSAVFVRAWKLQVPTSVTKTGFSDVASTAWDAGDISAMVKTGLIKGFPGGTFQPGGNITLAQFLTIVQRELGWQPVAGKTLPFTDVSSSDWFYSAIAASWDHGVWVNITGSTTLAAPNQDLTRGQVAQYVYDLSQYQSSGSASSTSSAG